MNERLLPFVFATLLASAAAGDARDPLPPDIRAALHSATRVMLYSLDPTAREKGTGFHSFRIVGYTAVEDVPSRERIATMLEQHVRAGGAGALCFNPHHGIRLISGGAIHDLVICYECGQVEIHSTGLGVRGVGIAGDMSYFDEILTAAKVPLAPRRHK